MKLTVCLLVTFLRCTLSAPSPRFPWSSGSSDVSTPHLHGGREWEPGEQTQTEDRPRRTRTEDRPRRAVQDQPNAHDNVIDNIIKIHVGTTVIPLNLDWTKAEMQDRMPDIPPQARLTVCSHYCKELHRKHRKGMTADECLEFCLECVDEHERVAKGQERAKDLGIKAGTTPWEPVLPMPRAPELQRRSTTTAFQNVSRAQMDRAVVAYDCSVPTLLETVQIPEKKATDCADQKTRVILQQNATLNVLQRVETFPVTVYRCRVKQTTIPTGCGMHSHQWLIHPWVEIEREQTISEQECKQMWETGQYVDPRGKVHDLRTESRNTVYSYLAGGIDTSAKNFGYCSGETVKKMGTLAEDMVISQHRTIDLFSFNATSDRQGKVHLPQENKILPCNVLAQGCLTQSGSYFWPRVDFNEHCPLFRTRQVDGIIVTDEGGQRSFLSRDDSLIRLRLRGTTVWCNQTVWETNFQKIVVTEDINYPLFNRPLTQASETSLVTYVNAQDYFLAGFLTERIQQEHDTMQRNDCLQMVEERELDYASLAAAQNVPVEGATVALGAGYFASARGDAYAKYRCKAILVMARNVDRCYAALPVTLRAEDENNYRLARGWPLGTNASEVEFFVTPTSHLLTTKGIEVECLPMMAPMFRGAYGSWITHTPEATFVSAEPATLQLTRQEVEEADRWELPDFEQGGIYEAEFVLAFDRQRQLSRATADVAVTLGRKAEETGWASGGYLGPQGPQLTLPGISVPTVADILWAAFYNWGVFVAGVLGLVALAFVVQCLAGFLCRLRGIPFHPEATRMAHTAVAVFPSLGAYLQRRNRRYQRRDRDPEGPLLGEDGEPRRPAPEAPIPGEMRIIRTDRHRYRRPRRDVEGQQTTDVPDVTLNSFGLASPLSPRRAALHAPALGTLRPESQDVMQMCISRIEQFEQLLRAEQPDTVLDPLKEKILREVLHLKGRIQRAAELNKPLNETAVASELVDIRRRYFSTRSLMHSPLASRTPTPDDSSDGSATLIYKEEGGTFGVSSGARIGTPSPPPPPEG